MIVIKGKRILLILTCIMVSIGVYEVAGTSFSLKQKEVAKTVVALPVSSKTIILDAGHGLPDGGAVSRAGTEESGINLDITLKVQSLLEQSGATVLLTRSDENGIYEESAESIRKKKVSDSKNRVSLGNNSHADIFVSIHLNKITESSATGWQTFYRSGDEPSEYLAKSLQDGLNETMQKESKRQPNKIGNVYIVKNVKIPITIVECGFLSNYEEETKLKTDEYQDKLAWGIYVGIMNYFY
jgi:N-acetylmuramoyl-L-alanine amidase